MKLNEDPDDINFDGVVANFRDHDANTFIYHVQDELLFMSKTGTTPAAAVYHHILLDLFGWIGSIFKDESRYEYDEKTGDWDEEPLPIETIDQFNQHCEMMGNDIYWDEAGGWIRWEKRSVQIYGDMDKAVKYMRSLAGKNRDNTPNFRQMYSSIGVMGRYWEDTSILGFWLMKRELGRLLSKGGLDGLFDYLGLEKENTRLATARDSDGLISVRDALEAVGEKPKMTRDQERELMMKQHLDPESKRKLNKDATRIDKYGGMLPAKYHAAQQTSDGVIKLGDLLKECPDGVYNDGGDHKMYSWGDDDAACFFAFPNVCLIKPRGVHDNIWRGMLQCYREQSLDPLSGDRYFDIEFDVSRGDLLKLLRPDGYLGKLMQLELGDKILDSRTGTPDGLSGRVWENAKVISFWNKRKDVLKNWKNVQSMFHRFFGNLDEYKVDWIERDADVESGKTPRPASSASEISAHSIGQHDDSRKQLDFFSKIVQNPQVLDRANDELIKKIQQKIHVLDPQVKAQVVRAMGELPTHKAVEIANKLGMSVAEFNDIMNVNEDSSRLRNLIPEV
jgi:hypothetical protein